ncbi:hypothetical protein DYB32_001402 [Aphanomyces invadans]|uniref:Uncharacterized protein n=1 Tax=Aphanomyces invadans TaxID=157072 RepID=A0A3R6Z9F6_9STRA|nr:hypothetical protein DYB32_001402 [Aphanomyces invadans]
MAKERSDDSTTHANVFPREGLQGDGLLHNPPNESSSKRPKPAPVVNIHKEYDANGSYHKTRQTIKEIITQHKAKALSNQERYMREQQAEKFRTTFLETRMATTGVPTLNTVSVVMERRRAQGEARMKGLANDTPTQAESIQIAIHQSYGSGKLDIKALGIDVLPEALSSTFMLQMARFITHVNISRNEFRTLSRQFCDGFPGCQVLNASENSIMSMAPEISRWSELTSLTLDCNRLTSLPDMLPSTLTCLSVARNRLNEVSYMYRLSALTYVDLSHNQLVTLPNAMYELKYLRTFACARNALITAALLPLPSFKSRRAKANSMDDDNDDDGDGDKPGMRAQDWVQQVDPATKQPIYYNNITRAVTRIRPAALGPTPSTTACVPKLVLPNSANSPDCSAPQAKQPTHTAKHFPGGWEVKKDVPTQFLNHTNGEIYDWCASNHCVKTNVVTVQHRVPKELDRYEGFVHMEHLNLSSNEIQELPSSMVLLQVLDVEHNQLSTLPDTICQLKNLTVLRVGSNFLTTLPTQFCRMPKIKELDMKLNRMVALPSDFGQLTSLTHLDVSGNSLVAVPPSVLQLTHLTTFNLVGNNHLKVPSAASQKNGIPAIFWEIKNQIHMYDRLLPVEIARLTSLRILTLRKNELTEFHAECIASSCPWEMLDCENNQLSQLPHTIAHCTNLRVLRMGCNILEKLPDQMDTLLALEECLVPHNHLAALPDTLAHLTALRVLDVSNNRIETLASFDFACPTNLVDFRANLNLLSELPPSIGRSNLLALSLSGNRFNVYPPPATEFKHIERIWMQANKIAELPVEFGNLRTLQLAQFDGNPLRSPPPDILAQGVEAIHAYLQKRIDRVVELKRLLAAAQYGFHDDHFTPQAKDLLHSGILFLLPSDLADFEKKTDTYINGPFYEHPTVRGVDLVQALVELQFQRAQTARKAVLEDVLKLCQLIQAKRWLDKVEFRYDLTRPWGFEAEDSLVYMIDPCALYNDWDDIPGILGVIKKRVERGFKDEAFNHTREVVEDALNHYKGVYGPVGLATDKVPFRCGCEELLRKNKRHEPCYRFGWVLLQIFISPEEAARRQREQEHLAQALCQARLLKEAKTLKGERKQRVKVIQKQLPHLKRQIELRRADLHVAIEKHALDKAVAGEGWMDQDEKQAMFVQEDINDDITRLGTQIHDMQALLMKIKGELRQDYNHYATEVIDKLLVEAGAQVRDRIINNHRIKAIRKQYRRPWDGPNGRDFIQFKQQHIGLPPVESPRDNSSISDVSGDLDDFANDWEEDSDGALPSLKSSSPSEDENEPNEKAKHVEGDKNSNGVADPDDSDDSDI